MKFLFQPWVLILIVVILFIIFAPKRIPDASKKMRKGMRAFDEEDSNASPSTAQKSSVKSAVPEPDKSPKD